VENQAEPAAREADPQLFRESYQTRLISGWVERDTRNAFFDPTRGSYQNGLIQFAGGALGGNNGFLKGTVGNIRFRGLPIGSWILATRVQVGYIIPSDKDTTVAGKPITSRVELIPLEDRYLLGGANSVRGYAQDGLDGQTGTSLAAGGTAGEGGLAQLLVNIEVRVPLFWRLGAVGFLDAGNVWQDRKAITWERFVPHGSRRDVESEDLRYSYGLGIRLGTPVGPFRIDYARKWNQPESNEEGRDRWHVAIGHAF
jgi:outer membrane protein insertion porin family